PWTGCRLLRGHLDAAIDQLVGEPLVLRRHIGVERIARFEVAADVLTGDHDTPNLPRIGRRNELAERDRFFVVLELGSKVPDQYPNDHEYDQEHQALQSGVKTDPPNREYCSLFLHAANAWAGLRKSQD